VIFGIIPEMLRFGLYRASKGKIALNPTHYKNKTPL